MNLYCFRVRLVLFFLLTADLSSAKFRHYNNHDQLAALQASVIYTLLLALEEETVDAAFVQVLMRSTGVSCNSSFS